MGDSHGDRMKPTMILPARETAWWLLSRAGIVEMDGTTNVGDMTGVNGAYDVVQAEGELALLEQVTGIDSEYNPLPDVGEWVEAGCIYTYLGEFVIVRQSHTRMHYDPVDTPALFIVWRPDADDVLAWVAGEQVHVGTQRIYDGVTYECIKAHVTQIDWTPPTTPTLWKVVQDEDEILPWVQPQGAHDAYPLGTKVTHNGFTWENVVVDNVWEPGVYGWVKVV